uniref:TPT domain-containing protein n=1 Tax=Schistosoma curassoni TaxID=6186 RepID=A0A183JXF5_9TREM
SIQVDHKIKKVKLTSTSLVTAVCRISSTLALFTLEPPGTRTILFAILIYSALACISSGVAIHTKRKTSELPNVAYDHFRKERIHFTAAIPLFAIRIWPMYVS